MGKHPNFFTKTFKQIKNKSKTIEEATQKTKKVTNR